MFERIAQPIKSAMQNMFRNGNPNNSNDNQPVYGSDNAAFVDKEYDRRLRERRPYELQWRLNLCFREGQQYVDINTVSLALEEQPILYDWEEREVFNHIRPLSDTRIAKLKRLRSIAKSRPGNPNDVKDINSAKIGSLILKNIHNDQRLRDKQAIEILWMELCGTVFRKHIWNPEKGRILGSQPVADEAGQLTGELKPVYEGDEEIIVCPAQEILPDSSYHQDLESCRSIIHAKAYHIDDIEDIWGIRAAPEKAQVEKLAATMNGLSGLGYGQGGFIMHTTKIENHAIVKEYYERPSKRCPQGRLIVSIGGQNPYSGPLPYRVGDNNVFDLSFSMLKCIDRPGVFWGATVIELLIPVQRRYNALRNRKAEYLNRCAIGQWNVQRESVDEDEFERNSGMPGAIHIYERGSIPPEPVKNGELPAAFMTEQKDLLEEMVILSGVSETSRQSAAPPGVKSGIALQFIQEQDDTRLSNTADNIERYNIHSGRTQLRLHKQFVKFPRTLNSVGRNNVAEVLDYTGSDIIGENVYIDNMAALAESPAQKRQMIFDLMESGLLFDPDTGKINRDMRSRIFDMIEMGEWEAADDADQLHISKAERENRALANGQLSEAVDYDDHVIHIDLHNRFRLSLDYEQLMAQYQQIEEIFDLHVNMHLMFMNQQAMAIAQQQAQQQAMIAGQGQDNGRGQAGGDNNATA